MTETLTGCAAAPSAYDLTAQRERLPNPPLRQNRSIPDIR